MSKVPQTIRPHVRRGPRLGVCLVVFLISGAAVYSVGQRQLERPPRYTAQAGVSYESPADPHAFHGPTPLPPWNLAEVERQILSDENLQQALNGAGVRVNGAAQGKQGLAQVREQVRIVGEGSAPRPMIAITYSGPESTQVRRFVNQLAEQYATAERARLATASRRYQETHQAAEQARRELQRGMARLEECLKQQAETRRSTVAEPPRPSLPPVEPPRTQMLDNPAWLELDRQLTALQQRRAQLLVDRTPAHPEVQYVEAQLGELRDAQARVPRQIPDSSGRVAAAPPMNRSPASETPTGALGQLVPSAPPAEASPASRELAALRAAVDRMKQNVDRLAHAERQARERQQATPQIHVHPADRCQVAGGPAGLSPRWLAIALSAGLVVATLVGFLSAILRRDRPVIGLAEIQTLVPAPIVGVISVPELGRRQRSPSTVTP